MHCVIHKMQQNMRDVSTTVKHVCLVHVYIEKVEKQRREIQKHGNQIWGQDLYCVTKMMLCIVKLFMCTKRHKPQEFVFTEKQYNTLDHFPKHNPQQRNRSLLSSFPVTQIEKAEVICVATVFIQRFYRNTEKILHWHIFMYHCLQLSTAGSLCHSQEPQGNQLPPCKGLSLIPVCCLISQKKRKKSLGNFWMLLDSIIGLDGSLLSAGYRVYYNKFVFVSLTMQSGSA